MTAFDVLVEVSLRPGIADPQGSTVERALPALGFENVHGVRVGKSIRFTIDAADEAAARGAVDELCKRFLTNPVIEDARITVVLGGGSRDIARDPPPRTGGELS
jgi:phosphoribosylformylglycinamidine synthase subunit PurS